MLIKRALSHRKLLYQSLPTNSSQKKATFCHHHLTLRWKKENPPPPFFTTSVITTTEQRKSTEFPATPETLPKKTSRILICSSPPESQCSRTPKATAGMLIPFLWALLEGSLGSKVLGTSRPVAAQPGGFRRRGGTGDCSQ